MTLPWTIPDYAGSSLVNLVAELERRLTGSASGPGLRSDLGELLPEARTYVLVLFDGLGSHQLGHPAAHALAASLRASIDAPFPTTTTVSLATIATGLAPAGHGLLGYQLYLPSVEEVANTIKWTTLWGDAIAYDTSRFLPAPNLWERLTAAGLEPVTVQPANFEGTPLSRALYRGCRYEPVTTLNDWIEATAIVAAEPGRLVLAYLPHIDFAAHVYGQRSAEYADALRTVTEAWERLTRRLTPGTIAVGTADHGHVDFPKDRQAKIPKAEHRDRIFYGDGRVMFVKGDGAGLASGLPATWVPREEMEHWWGPEPRHPGFTGRAPDGVLVADDERLLLHRFSDDRMIGNHGGLTAEERRIPLLVAGPEAETD
jgi:hypothetical protein